MMKHSKNTILNGLTLAAIGLTVAVASGCGGAASTTASSTPATTTTTATPATSAPGGFTLQPGATRVVHFDNTVATDHYPVNKYSLYYTDKNALVVDVTASSPTVKVATFTVTKSAGGAEAGVESTTAPPSGTGQVLPVAKNPISNTSTAPGLTITKVLVENNISPDTGKAVGDHLEIALKNTSTKPLGHIAIYYTFSDKATATTEGYYAKL